MTIWELCIKRPIFTVMLVSAPIVLGLASYPRLGVDLFPNVDLPLVTVTTTLRGASVEEMETGHEADRGDREHGLGHRTVTVDDEGRDLANHDRVRTRQRWRRGGSRSRRESAHDFESVARGTDAPIIDKFALDAAPVMTVAVSGRRDAREITEIARRRIKEDLESLSGVGRGDSGRRSPTGRADFDRYR